MTRGPAQITSVIPADDYDLIDLATLKTLLGITTTASDDFLTLQIPMASKAVANFCNDPLVVEAIIESFWPQRDGYPWIVRGEISPLQLKRYPLTTIASVTETIDGVVTTLVSGTDYLPDNDQGQIVRLGCDGYPRSWRANPIVVSYSAGYATIPGDVIDAVSRLLKGAYYAQLRDPAIRSQNSPGVYEAAYWLGNGPGSDPGLPLDVQGLLENYRVPVVG